MKVCFFGTYTVAPGYPVNRVLVKGLKRAGLEVEECREELWGGFLHELFGGGPRTWLRLAWRALLRYPRLMRRYWRSGEHQIVIVGYAGYVDIVLARILNWRRRRPLVLVAFISLYDTAVVDREKVSGASFRGTLLKRIDRLAFRCADLVLVDTWQQRDYYARLFDLPSTKFHRSFVGEDDEVFRALPLQKRRGRSFEVLFFGTYVPLHGIETILAAASHLDSDSTIHFTLIGRGQLLAPMRQRAAESDLTQVEFVEDWLAESQLIERIGTADVCLGIFGNTAKAARVIPYKVFDSLALQKPVITRDSPAIREFLCDQENALLCPPADGAALAAAILRLKNDPVLAHRLAVAGHDRYCQLGSPAAIGRALERELEERFAVDWHH